MIGGFAFFLSYEEFLLELSLGVLSSSSIIIHFLLDFYSLLFLSFILLISSVVVFYRIYYMDGDLGLVRFLALVLLFVFSILFLVLSPSLLGLIFGWDGLGVTSFLLVIFYNNVSSLRSGMLTVYTNRLGDIFLLFALFYFFSGGWYSLDSFYSSNFFGLFFIYIVAAGITKRAQLPFSSWLPAAIAAPTPVSSLVHSSTLVTAGVYLFIRFFFLFGGNILSRAFGVLFLLTSFSAGLFACCEVDLKKLVAISTLRQLGIMITCLRVSFIYYSFFHIVSHALFKSLLFLRCGVLILLGSGLQDMRFKGRKTYFRLAVLLILIVANLRLCGVPFLSGFFSRDLIIEILIVMGTNSWAFHVFALSCVFSIIYSFKMVRFGTINKSLTATRVVGGVYLIKFILIAVLCVWSISLGGLFYYFFLDGEYSLFYLWDRVIGVLFFFAFFFYFSLFSAALFFLAEMLWLNWVFSSYFSLRYNSINTILLGEQYWAEFLLPKSFLKATGYYLITVSPYSSYLKVAIFLLWFLLFLALLVLPFSLLKRWFEGSESWGKQNVFFLPFCLP